MNTLRTVARTALFSALVILTGCASYKPVADGFTGPVAVIRDSAAHESGGKGRVFFVEEVDGNPVYNARAAIKQASYGMGFSLRLAPAERAVPIRPMRLKLIASHITAAPIHEMASRASGEFFDVEGVVDFTPVADHKYVVRGDLKKDASTVWIEDEETSEVVTKKVGVKAS